MPRIVSVVASEVSERKRRRMYDALRQQGATVEVANADQPGWLDWVAKAAAFSPRGMQRWRERYEYSPVTRLGMSYLGARRARRLDPSPDVLLQIGAYYDFTRMPGPKPALRCSYHDANLAVFAREGTFIRDPDAGHIKRTMAAERRVFDRLDLIFTMSDWLRRSFIEDFDQHPDKVVKVGLGANVPRIPDVPERDWARPRLLFIGYEWARKGGPDLLAAFASVKSEHPDCELTIVGVDPPPDAGSHPGVSWFGRIDRSVPEGDAEMERLHREATAYVMPSLFEPLGNVFLEAMAWGLPCVGTDRGSMPETIEHGVTGLIAAANDPDGLAGILNELVSDPSLAQRLGEAGRERFLEHHTWDSVAARMLSEMERRL